MNTKQKRPTKLPTPLSKTKVRKIQYRKSFAVKELERMANDEARKKNPTIPLEWLAKRTYQSHIEQAGGIYVIARTFKQFYNWYQLNFGRTCDEN